MSETKSAAARDKASLLVMSENKDKNLQKSACKKKPKGNNKLALVKPLLTASSLSSLQFKPKSALQDQVLNKHRNHQRENHSLDRTVLHFTNNKSSSKSRLIVKTSTGVA